MTQNDFFVAIQYILETAEREGWSLRQIDRDAGDAIQEYLEVKGYYKEEDE